MKKIYFTGIKGVGMAPLAILLSQKGHVVGGSDTQEKFITDKLLHKENIQIDVGFKKENVTKFFKDSNQEDIILIHTAAHAGRSNEEVQEAQSMGGKVFSFGKALGELSRGEIFGFKKKTIAVTGTHGKTTTASILANTLNELNANPSYVIGTSEIYPLGAPGHLGEGEYFVVEADEYVSDPVFEKEAKFLSLKPELAIITNIDYDHPDIFNNLEDVKKTFEEFAKHVPNDKFLVVNSDDQNTIEVVAKTGKKFISFGSNKGADFCYKILTQSVSGTTFEVKTDTSVQKVTIQLSGEHNVSNTTAVFALLTTLKYDSSRVAQALSKFQGSKRRSEKKGETENGAVVVDDYAHHPEEIRVTLDGLKQKYNKKLICVFQPHTYSRTSALLNEFAKSFKQAEELILLPIFASAREKDTKSITDNEYKKAFERENKLVFMLDNHAAVIKYLKDKDFDDNYVIISMGAGDVYKISEAILNKNPKKTQ